MSDQIKHECGIAMVRLLKPLEYYRQKYGSLQYGMHNLYLLMEKQHNRGQDGAGVVSVKFDSAPGKEYIFRERSNQYEPIRVVFDNIKSAQDKFSKEYPELINTPQGVVDNMPFIGNVMLGHLRYGTFGKNNIECVHPVMRLNNWKSRCLALAGNFNLTNVQEVFNHLISLGQHPGNMSDTVTILENVSHFLNDEVEKTLFHFKTAGFNKQQCTPLIQSSLDIVNILKRSSKRWDGGYVIGGVLGHGDAFVMRDPWGIRPAFYYVNDEVAVVASERPVIQTVFNAKADDVKELGFGNALIIRRNGDIHEENIRERQKESQCSFERIYFSRGSDKDIYRERKKLGELIFPAVLKEVDNDMDNTVLSYIPNTAETAYYGMVAANEEFYKQRRINLLCQNNGCHSKEEIEKIMASGPRTEKIAIKDIKLRTFITQDADRDDMVKHVYDITYGTINQGKDNLVIIDDSIVRGTTLKQSVIKILDRLNPKKIVIVSSAPQIRYPDCYGIDMAKLDDFIAFRAAVELLKDTGRENILDEVYQLCQSDLAKPKEDVVNHVKKIYEPFTAEEISKKIASMLVTDEIKAEVSIVYQSIDNLHKALPGHSGDWYFTGNYPTPGGNCVANRSFINYIEGRKERAY